MSNEIFLVFLLVIMVCVAVMFATGIFGRPNNVGSFPHQDNFESKFRIVELQNGKYRIEQNDGLEWGMPEFLGPHIADSLDEAKSIKATYVREKALQAGYRMKRVVD